MTGMLDFFENIFFHCSVFYTAKTMELKDREMRAILILFYFFCPTVGFF